MALLARFLFLTALLSAAACTSTAGASAKTLYVNLATGDDSITYAANSPATPWKTIGRAAWGSANRSTPNANEAAHAGDVVRVAAGTYTTSGGIDRWAVAYNPVNEGTADAPIRFEAEGVVHLTFASGTGPMIGANARDYVEWSGFTIDEKTAPSRPDTGPVVFFDTAGGGIENSTLIGNPNWSARVGDNYSAIRIHAARGQFVRNNRITGYGGRTGDENHSGLITYWAADLLIEHNEIDNCGSGLYLKGNNLAKPVVGAFTVRYNVLHGNSEGIRVLLIPSTADQPNLIHQNIIRNNGTGITITGFNGGTSDARHAKILNNVFVDNGTGFFLHGAPVPGAGHVFWNNIVSGGEHSIAHTGAPGNLNKDQFDAEHNVYSGSGASHSTLPNDERRTLGSWRRTFRQDGSSPESVDANPMFVDPRSHDYRLKPKSPAAALGRARFGIGGADGSVIPAGAYVTGDEVIGRKPAP